MDGIKLPSAAFLLLLTTIISASAFGQNPYPTSGGDQTVTLEQVEKCKELGIPAFSCTQQTILAKLRIIKAMEAESKGERFLGDSGTSLFAGGFGEMASFIGALGAIFGAVAVAFFAKSRIGRKVPI